jgi:hypothetical protein
MRDTIFIGHANPEDNEFTQWIASKLVNEGFKVWYDVRELVGGEQDFWGGIQSELDNNSCKYLLVLSKATFKKSGVLDEWEYIRSLERRENLQDFIIPLRVDDVAFDIRIGLNRKNIIDFKGRWAFGLKRLFTKLEKDGVYKNRSQTQQSLSEWYDNRFTTQKGVFDKTEQYYSNWLPINNLPDSIYLHEYYNDAQAALVVKHDDEFPSFAQDKYVVTFSDKSIDVLAPSNIDSDEYLIKSRSRKSVRVKDILNGYDSKEFPRRKDAHNFLVRLLNEAISRFLKEKRLSLYELSNSMCFFYEKGVVADDKVKFLYRGKNKSKQLLGKYFDDMWHYGVSIQAKLQPFPSFSVKAHIVFTNDGKTVFEDKSKMHTARRKKGRQMFNDAWRDLLLAFLFSVSEDDKISIKLTSAYSIILDNKPQIFESSQGYDEPGSIERLAPIDAYDEESEEAAESL